MLVLIANALKKQSLTMVPAESVPHSKAHKKPCGCKKFGATYTYLLAYATVIM